MVGKSECKGREEVVCVCVCGQDVESEVDFDCQFHVTRHLSCERPSD